MKQRRPLPSPSERIVKAAIRLFAKNGFSGTTTKKIAAAARMNEALIFRHFPTKQDLYAAIIQQKIDADPLLGATDDTALTDESDEAALRSLGLRMFELVERDPDFVRLLYFSALEGHKLSTMFFDTYVQRLNRIVSERIECGEQRGEIRQVNAYLAARAFIGMTAHYLLVRELFAPKQEEFSKQEVVDTFVGIFLRGVTQSGKGSSPKAVRKRE